MNAVDTNVLVYAGDASEPAKQLLAAELVDDLLADDEPVVVLWQVAVEYAACLRRWEARGRITRDRTVELVQTLEKVFRCVFPTRSLLRPALELSGQHSLSH